VEMDDVVHVYPSWEVEIHDVEGGRNDSPCWCDPVYLEGGRIIVHRSFDGGGE